MKQRDLINKLENAGFVFERHGGKFENKFSNYLLVAVSQARLAICRGIITIYTEEELI